MVEQLTLNQRVWSSILHAPTKNLAVRGFWSQAHEVGEETRYKIAVPIKC